MAEERCDECGLSIADCNWNAIRARFDERAEPARRDFALACRLFEDFLPGMNLETTSITDDGRKHVWAKAYWPGEGIQAFWPGKGESFEICSARPASEIVVELIGDILDGRP